MRPFDNHKRLVEKLHIILDEASVEYDRDCDVVDDFVQYVKDWETRRSEQEEIWIRHERNSCWRPAGTRTSGT